MPSIFTTSIHTQFATAFCLYRAVMFTYRFSPRLSAILKGESALGMRLMSLSLGEKLEFFHGSPDFLYQGLAGLPYYKY